MHRVTRHSNVCLYGFTQHLWIMSYSGFITTSTPTPLHPERKLPSFRGFLPIGIERTTFKTGYRPRPSARRPSHLSIKIHLSSDAHPSIPSGDIKGSKLDPK